MTTSITLLERVRRRDDVEAWNRFVQLYTPLLFYWARRSGAQDADAADLVQDVFLQLTRTLPEFAYDQNKSFRNWLRTITLNKVRQLYREGPTVVAPERNDLSQLPDPTDGDEQEAAEYRGYLVKQALEQIRGEFSPATWAAFQSYVLSDQPAEQVAAELGVRVGTVYAAKCRVLQRLRTELEGLLN